MFIVQDSYESRRESAETCGFISNMRKPVLDDACSFDKRWLSFYNLINELLYADIFLPHSSEKTTCQTFDLGDSIANH